MKEQIFCGRCGSKKVKRDGKQISQNKTFWKQKYCCLNCNRKFTNRTKHLMDYEELPFVYQSKPLPKIDWRSYNKAQLNEKAMLMDLIKEIIDLIEIEEIQKTGRPPSRIKDILFCMMVKIYSKLSARRNNSDLEFAKKMGYIEKIPCYATLMNYFNDKRLTKLLQELIELSSLPLCQLTEGVFAGDSTGFSTSQFGRWFNYRNGKEEDQRVYQKAHLVCDTRTNTVTAVKITTQYGADCPQLKYLVKRTALYFKVKEFSFDKAYLSIENMKTIDSVGATPYILFKKNSKASRGRQGFVWKRMYWLFKKNPQKFFEHYHKRSKVEAVMNMIKQKFGVYLMTKNEMANFNEILCKILCHNICCLISAYYKFDMHRTFWTEPSKMKKVSFVY